MKAAGEHVQQQYAFSLRRAFGPLMVAVSSCRYQPRHPDEELRVRLVKLAREKPRFGYRRLHLLLRNGGEVVDQKRVHRYIEKRVWRCGARGANTAFSGKAHRCGSTRPPT